MTLAEMNKLTIYNTEPTISKSPCCSFKKSIPQGTMCSSTNLPRPSVVLTPDKDNDGKGVFCKVFQRAYTKFVSQWLGKPADILALDYLDKYHDNGVANPSLPN